VTNGSPWLEADLQRGGDAVAADPTFNQEMDKELSKVFLPGVSSQTAFRRIV
jgi:hypothetical protein